MALIQKVYGVRTSILPRIFRVHGIFDWRSLLFFVARPRDFSRVIGRTVLLMTHSLVAL